ncbi:hypothetical protein L1987_13187 [Smallanthus sonchifolius]|uniref:Uncharacterized protein n=1 Tax=Smallanthus sonchifolius TaxID=185202 RepID=A0ACB9JHD6_9ASTR|nr:hypothetical protein L1987_13187 [Smallanthus sonchifolius]
MEVERVPASQFLFVQSHTKKHRRQCRLTDGGPYEGATSSDEEGGDNEVREGGKERTEVFNLEQRKIYVKVRTNLGDEPQKDNDDGVVLLMN